MSILKIWLILSFSFLWTEVSWSKEVKYKDLPSLIKTNKKSKSLDFLIDSEKERISFLTRSFVPEVKLFAGQEEFHSNRLGDHSSSYHGVEARANVFNGMSDYWEEEKRKSELELSKAQKKISYGEMVYEARRSYLNLAEAQKIKAELNDSLSRLSGVFKKVQLKVKGGVISQSDLISLRLVQVELEHKIKDLDGVISIELARLKSFLSLSDLNINDIDQEVLGLTPDQKQPIGKPLLEEKFKAESGIFASESHALSGKKLPSVDLVAN
ncbi:MAG: TolC family protein, partial [Bdellovibrionales bacterium]|nr:TolC family protein [Bdellovibrionales bacterium]